MNANAAFSPAKRLMGRPRSHKSRFTPEEDELLKNLIQQFGTENWSTIAAKMPHRNERQVRDRWISSLDPDINREPFTPDEDKLLLELYDTIGPKWVHLRKYFNKRTDVALKTRWLSLKRLADRGGKPRKASTKKEAKLPTVVIAQPSSPELPMFENVESQDSSDPLRYIDEFFVTFNTPQATIETSIIEDLL
ncbi:Myb-like DNA-binding domain containing protein [Trichomonas vaginalis G3]|uniref:Myb-like DNA-binding domain containing protein n=1 Tax=Trichomonas vaginalis (strain ATCC PRA-98 / G3) TaxID=412133 RepID=A2G0M4_TRIV3|nr:RNA polymerase II transcription regulator recruiting protein [Trichomonas vaginalis G3]EAX89296.1 Myb-like DNA-binding domain containing protein [Trichomonas vaginalis G3]KAI5514739.1 RNA polymerase II transcription regulator recruiting protein [Trichomonas vaginalis G3]|eukprot:XP_001302226.1 Myb-like DNA-binding domain containing protein [Trichomonas vaginalis G3]